jgi:hypothetical protein
LRVRLVIDEGFIKEAVKCRAEGLEGVHVSNMSIGEGIALVESFFKELTSVMA